MGPFKGGYRGHTELRALDLGRQGTSLGEGVYRGYIGAYRIDGPEVRGLLENQVDKHMGNFVDDDGSPLEAVIRVSYSICGLDRLKFPQEEGMRVWGCLGF